MGQHIEIQTHYKIINREELERVLADIVVKTMNVPFTTSEWKFGNCYAMQSEKCKLIAVTHDSGSMSVAIRIKLDESFYCTKILKVDLIEGQFDIERMDMKDIQSGLINSILESDGDESCRIEYKKVGAYVYCLQSFMQYGLDDNVRCNSITFEYFSYLMYALHDFQMISLYQE